MVKLQIKEAKCRFHPGYTEICVCIFHIFFCIKPDLLVHFLPFGNIPKKKIKAAGVRKLQRHLCCLQMMLWLSGFLQCASGSLEDIIGPKSDLRRFASYVASYG